MTKRFKWVMKRMYFTWEGALRQIANAPDYYKSMSSLTCLLEACATLLLSCTWPEALAQM